MNKILFQVQLWSKGYVVPNKILELHSIEGIAAIVNYTFIFHKAEIPTAILRCWMSPNFNWYKSYDKKHKNVKNKKDANICFCTKSQKKKEMEIFAFCIINFQPIINKAC